MSRNKPDRTVSAGKCRSRQYPVWVPVVVDARHTYSLPDGWALAGGGSAAVTVCGPAWI